MKLADWYGIQSAKFVSARPEDVNKQKTPQHMAEESKEKPKTQMQSSNQNVTTGNGSVNGYMAETEVWFRELCVYGDETEEAYQYRILKGVKNRCYESYQRGLQEGKKAR